MCTVGCFISSYKLKNVDVVGFWQVLRTLYTVKIFDGGFKVETQVSPYESKNHVFRELILDIESLLKKFQLN